MTAQPRAGKPGFRERRNRLREATGRGWLLLYKGGEYFNENLYYLTGLDAFHTLALISLESDREYVLTNPFEFQSVRESCQIEHIRSASPDELAIRLNKLLSEHKVSLLYCDYAIFSRTPLPPEWVDCLRSTFPQPVIEPLPPQLSQMRMIKDPFEMAVMEKGVRIVDDLLARLPELIKPGLREAELASEIYRTLVYNGFNKFYDILVASGPNSAVPLYRANRGVLPENGVVLVDICAALDYYLCDMTRTYPTSGSFTSRQDELFSIIQETHQRMLAAVQPGTTLARLSTTAKEIFARHRLEMYYLNKLGHFVGLAPDDPGDQDTPLRAGMVLTIEPGLYCPEEYFGLRVEDMVFMASNGCTNSAIHRKP
jgi:Xaa-Pro aminopeptidase